MWTLIVLIVGSLPPAGAVQTGFATEEACLAEARYYCDGTKKLRCKCQQDVTYPTE